MSKIGFIYYKHLADNTTTQNLNQKANTENDTRSEHIRNNGIHSHNDTSVYDYSSNVLFDYTNRLSFVINKINKIDARFSSNIVDIFNDFK